MNVWCLDVLGRLWCSIVLDAVAYIRLQLGLSLDFCITLFHHTYTHAHVMIYIPGLFTFRMPVVPLCFKIVRVCNTDRSSRHRGVVRNTVSVMSKLSAILVSHVISLDCAAT